MKSRIILLACAFAALLTTAPHLVSTPDSPTTRFLLFRDCIVKGEAETSWKMLSHQTQSDIGQEVRKILAGLNELRTLTTDPAMIKCLDDLFADMHLNNINSDCDCWAAMLAEALEHGTRPAYFSPELKVTGEQITGNTATLDARSGDASGLINMLLEDGQWKVDKPYVIRLAEAGWNVDLAVSLAKIPTTKTPLVPNPQQLAIKQKPALIYPILKGRNPQQPCISSL
jgi:hypothetical protein